MAAGWRVGGNGVGGEIALLTKLDERVWARDRLDLAMVQVRELSVELLQILVGQLFGVHLVGEREVAHARVVEVVEAVVPGVHCTLGRHGRCLALSEGLDDRLVGWDRWGGGSVSERSSQQTG